MQKILEILRHKLELGRSHREVAQSLGVSVGSVAKVLRRWEASGLQWPQARELGEDALESALYGSAGNEDRPRPDYAQVHRELRRPGVTLQLLHLEYLEQHPEGYRYTQFCEHYRRWRKRQKRSMRQVHRGGEKLFVDYAGKKPHLVDRQTGECIEVELFVGAMGASHLIYAEATRTQQGPDWIGSHVRALEYLGGVPGALVCDQLKSGVAVPCRYEPGLQRTYEEMARHYQTTILPARPGKPQDKAKVEVAVQVAERWILARLRDEVFFSLHALNERIAELLEEINGRVMRGYQASRRELFERYDRPHLRPLPADRFLFCRWKRARVNIDYHVDYEKHCYSVHHSLLHESVEIRVTEQTVEIYHKGQRVASHRRSHRKGGHTTVAEHMPVAHRQHAEWSPSRLIRWGQTVGTHTAELIAAILDDRPHPEQGYRSCLGILRLAKRYGNDRLEAACERAVAVRARSYRHVDSILKHGLDRVPTPQPAAPPARASHEHVRGAAYYHPRKEDPC
jgi:transposase